MKHRGVAKSKVLVLGLTVLVLGLIPRVAEAQALWNPTDGRAKPVAILAADISMTSHFNTADGVKSRTNADVEAVRRGGNGCYTGCHDHRNDGLYMNDIRRRDKTLHPRHLTALFQGLARIRSITEEFEEQFVWGGFTYSGAHYAQIVRRAHPEVSALQSSFSRVFGTGPESMLNAAALNEYLDAETDNRVKRWKVCDVQNPFKQGTEYCYVWWGDTHRRTRRYETGEHVLPPDADVSSAPEPNGCLMPDPNGLCQHDDETLAELVKTGVQGLTFPPFPMTAVGASGEPVPALCDLPDAPEPVVNPLSELRGAIADGGWPQWTDVNAAGEVPEHRVEDGFCKPLQHALERVRDELGACLTTPAAYLDLSFLSQPSSTWCDPAVIKKHICASGPLVDSCLCQADKNPEGCKHSLGRTPCGTVMSVRRGRPGRHQWAACELSPENPREGTIGHHLGQSPGQFDNVSQTKDGRENIAIFYTDGYFGGVKSGYDAMMRNAMDMDNPDAPLIVGEYMRPQAEQTLDAGFWATRTQERTSNIFVLNHMRDGTALRARDRTYTPGSHRFQETLFDPSIERPYPPAPGLDKTNAWGIPDAHESNPAIDLDSLRASLRRSIQRATAGAYQGAQPSLDRTAELMVVPGFHVFGPKRVGRPAAHPGEEYAPRAARLSFYTRGERGPPELLCETDWQDKASAQLAAAGTEWARDPLTQFGHSIYSDPARGLVRSVPAGILDRDGDGDADGHPALSLGRMSGLNAAAPVIVAAPVEIPLGADAEAFSEFMLSARSRPQVVYAMSNGFIHGFHAGKFEKTRDGLRYDLGDSDVCKELWRFQPSWVTDDDVIAANTEQARQLMDGEMVAHELRVAYAGRSSDYKTILVAAQGKMGRGMVALDVTNPMIPKRFRSWLLPSGFRASAQPTVVEAVSGRDGQLRPMVFMSGGYRGLAALHMFDLASGEEASISLPANPGEDYPTAPVCFDRDGRGGASHCYLVSRFGRVTRVEIDPNDGTASISPDSTLADALADRAMRECLAQLEPTLAFVEPGFEGEVADCEDLGGELPVAEAPVRGTEHVRFGEVRDLSPAGLPDTAANGKRFYVSPTVYFDERGHVNLIFGSGDIKEMQRPAAGQNFVYRLVEPLRGAFRLQSSRVCAPDARGQDSGIIELPEGHLMVSPASVSKGVVSFTAYRPPSSALERGTSVLFSMNYATCADAVSTAARPEARPIGEGLPGTPLLVGPEGTILAATTMRSGSQINSVTDAKAVADGRIRVRRLYWRPLTSDRAVVELGIRPRLPRPELLEEPEASEEPLPEGPELESPHVR